MAEAASPSSHSSFCEEVFSVVVGIGDPGGRDHRSRLQPNEMDQTNILAPGFWSGTRRTRLLPAFTSKTFRRLAHWKVVSSYSSATAPEFHGISCADPLFQARKELGPTTSGLRFEGQDYLITCQPVLSCQAKSPAKPQLMRRLETSLAIKIRDSSTLLGMTTNTAW
jgi:hypothetical protein